MAGKTDIDSHRSIARRLLHHIQLWGTFVRFSHTVFALPFALAMLVIVSSRSNVSFSQVVTIIIAVIAARTAAMSFNRIVDAQIDTRNPRTANREIPAGRISYASATLLLCLSSLAFLFASALLGNHCLLLAPIVILILLGYSLTKRFTSGAHFVLGIALACAPGGVWYAITAEFAWFPVWMMLGVLFWVAGFDILYALQDESFDKKSNLYSMPVLVGSKCALSIARLSHILAVIFFIIFGITANLSFAYAAGVVFFAWMLFSQQRLVRVDELDKIERTFFNRNAWGSIVYFFAVLIDVIISAL